MKKIFIALLLLLLLSSCSQNVVEEDPSKPNENDESSDSESVAEIDYDYYHKRVENYNRDESEFDYPTNYDDDICFTIEVPDLTGKDMSELPYWDEPSNWCIYGTDWVQLEEKDFRQYFLDETEEVTALAKAIALFMPHVDILNADGHYGSKTFDTINDANEKELLWAAICQTPQKGFSDNDDHAVNFAMHYIYETTEHSYCAEEKYSVDDVEKTFRWLFGEDANFVPQNIEQLGIRYFEELGIFVQFFDGIMMWQDVPQIISYTEKDGVYTAKVVRTSTTWIVPWEEEEVGFYIPYTDGTNEWCPLNDETKDLLSELYVPRTYTFEKADDGHFVLTGFNY